MLTSNANAKTTKNFYLYSASRMTGKHHLRQIPHQLQLTSSTKVKLNLELEALPAKIDEFEKTLLDLNNEINTQGFYNDADKSAQVLAQVNKTQSDLDNAYARWDELESLKLQ